MKYLVGVEASMLEEVSTTHPHLGVMGDISRDVIADAEIAVRKASFIR
jgi:hypothetical protein